MLQPVAATAPGPEPGHGSARKAFMLGTLIGGAVLVVTGGVLGVVFEVERGNLQTDLAENYGTHKATPIITDPCKPPPGVTAAPGNQIAAGCSAGNSASAVGVPEAVALGLGGALLVTGVVLLATQPKDAPAAPQAGLRGRRILPGVGPQGASLGLSGSF